MAVQCSGPSGEPHELTNVEPRRRADGRLTYDCPICHYDVSIASAPAWLEAGAVDLHYLAVLVTAGKVPS